MSAGVLQNEYSENIEGCMFLHCLNSAMYYFSYIVNASVFHSCRQIIYVMNVPSP